MNHSPFTRQDSVWSTTRSRRLCPSVYSTSNPEAMVRGVLANEDCHSPCYERLIQNLRMPMFHKRKNSMNRRHTYMPFPGTQLSSSYKRSASSAAESSVKRI
jgi:hypothetical protein